MESFRCRPSFFARARLDPELMDFDFPGRRRRREAAEESGAELEDRLQARAVGDRGRDRLEPARDAAVDRVVIDRLVMRLMLEPTERPFSVGGEHGMTPAPVPTAGGHVG